jgi:hypothetical protein
MRVLLSLLAVVAAMCVGYVAAVTIDDLKLNEETCRVIRNNAALAGSIPCDCRLNTGSQTPVRCYPNCCPRSTKFEGDRCHEQNRLTWSVYEQLVCEPRPPAEYTDDTPNCFYKGNTPDIHSAVTASGKTTIKFSLSLVDEHLCSNLYVAKCEDQRPSLFAGFRLNTSDPRPEYKYCWLPCSPPPVEECTATSCWAHRGKTHAKIHEWTLDKALGWGDYALVCQTLMQHVAEGSSLYQDAYASAFFRLT